MPDLIVHNHGSIFLLEPITPAADLWIGEHTPTDAQTWGRSIVVEHRFIDTIVAGAIHDGLEVQ